MERKLKSSQILVNYYKKESSCKDINRLEKVDDALPMNKDPIKYFCQSIEKLISTVPPGKHVHEKASLFITALSTGIPFKGEGLNILNKLKQ
jgi:hypothetical protein